MANWNSGFYFNRSGDEGGFVWNSDTYVIILRLNDVLRIKDDFSQQLATLILREQGQRVRDELVFTALYTTNDNETLKVRDEVKVSLIFFLAEEIGIKDEFSDLLVLAFLHDKTKVVDQAKIFANILTNDKALVKDITNVEAFLETMDKFNLKDLKAALQTFLSVYDHFGMTDKEPRTAVSDFVIGNVDDLDHAYDWLIPFGLRIDWDDTKIQVMPEAELTTIQMPGVDGSIVADSVYRDRLFEIVAYSEDGLSIQQKEILKAKITRVLDATKHRTKKLTVQANSTSFDVRYEGQAEITDGPSFVKAKIPLHTEPYGYDLFDHELDGIGLIVNDGDAPMRVIHTISGYITNPSFSLGTVTYTYKGTIASESKLIINHDDMTCYIEDKYGKKTNALANLVGDFQAIPVDSSVVLNASNSVASHIHTEWKVKVLW